MGNAQTKSRNRLNIFRQRGRFRRSLRNVLSAIRTKATDGNGTSDPAAASRKHATREQIRHHAEATAAIGATRLMR